MSIPRSDLALEAAEQLSASTKNGAAPGVELRRFRREGYAVTELRVLDRQGAEALGRPPGRYVTMELGPAPRRDEDLFRRGARCLARELAALLPRGPVLVAGLGNRAMTCDAVGPAAVEHLLVTRHMSGPGPFARLRPVSALCTEVLGRTGMETLELLRGVTERVRPAAVIAVDALAARDRQRLCRTVQLADTGLVPGSGVGNHRRAIDRESLGVPVIAVGVPTVVDAEPEAGLYLTPRDIDRQVRELGRLLGYGITLALQPGLTVQDVAALLG